MAKNRSIEAKRIKYIKQVRARPRSLKMNNGYIKASQGNSKDHIPKDARPLFEYRKRATIEGNEYVEVFITAVCDTLYPRFSDPVPKVRAPEALRHVVNKLEPIDRKMLIQNGRYVKLAVLANRDLDCVEFVEYQIIPGIVRRSITYNSYNRAMQVHHLGTIRWKTVINIDVEQTAPSSNT